MERLLIVYPGYNDEIKCSSIMKDDKGYICFTDEAPKFIVSCSSFKVAGGFFVCEKCGKQYKKLPADDMQCSIITVKEEAPTPPAPPPGRHIGGNTI